ncbi:Hypothetical protein AAM4_2752 [Actinomyces succiniciruminis]|uniref:Uncharacterized protein n=1 Tax=Actinomyces succiniciruminis TaxID=1522002 RepID=A0A1L7RT18_9ACTO|nr:Hypothetical protein AAM4_2752 [Actinomyces succiniciruminis]
MGAGRDMIAVRSGQRALELESLAADSAQAVVPPAVEAKRSAVLWDVLSEAYERLSLGEATVGLKGLGRW